MSDRPYTRRDASLLATVEDLIDGGIGLSPEAGERLRRALLDGLDARLLMAWRKSEMAIGELITETAGEYTAQFLDQDDELLIRYLETEVSERAK